MSSNNRVTARKAANIPASAAQIADNNSACSQPGGRRVAAAVTDLLQHSSRYILDWFVPRGRSAV